VGDVIDFETGERVMWEHEHHVLERRTGLTATQKLVLLAIAHHYNENEGCARPSLATLCEVTERSRNTVRAAIDAAVAAGELTILEPGKWHRATRYGLPHWRSDQRVNRLTLCDSSEGQSRGSEGQSDPAQRVNPAVGKLRSERKNEARTHAGATSSAAPEGRPRRIDWKRIRGGPSTAESIRRCAQIVEAYPDIYERFKRDPRQQDMPRHLDTLYREGRWYELRDVFESWEQIYAEEDAKEAS
jgi:hypothetical protein